MIRLKHIYKSYAMGEIDVPVLKDVSLHIKPHEFVSVLGPSGSGKSTLMNIIGCLDIPDSGEYLLEGENVADCSENELSKIRGTKIGFIFQQFNLICSGHGTRWTVPLLSATAFIKSSAFWRNRVPVCRAATIKKS